MSDRDWYDDGDYREASRQAERVTRWSWTAIAGVTGFLALVVVALVVVSLLAVVALAYAAVSLD